MVPDIAKIAILSYGYFTTNRECYPLLSHKLWGMQSREDR